MPSTASAKPDPGGNNGTVKVGDIDLDSNANDPMIGCPLSIAWFNFALPDGQSETNATVTFQLKAPTKGGDYGLSVTSGDTTPTFVPSGGSGMNHIEYYTLDFTGAPKTHGYHVKITVQTPYANTVQTKFKTFWVAPCTPPVDNEIDVPAAPATVDPCGPDNIAWVEVPADTETIDWTLNQDGSLTATPISPAYFPNEQTSVTFDLPADSDVDCGLIDVPAAPATVDPCGPDNVAWVEVPADTESIDWTLNQDGSLTATPISPAYFPNEQTSVTFDLPADSGEVCATDTPTVLPSEATKSPTVLPTAVDAGLAAVATGSGNSSGGSTSQGLIVAGLFMIFAAASLFLSGRQRGSRQI